MNGGAVVGTDYFGQAKLAEDPLEGGMNEDQRARVACHPCSRSTLSRMYPGLNPPDSPEHMSISLDVIGGRGGAFKEANNNSADCRHYDVR